MEHRAFVKFFLSWNRKENTTVLKSASNKMMLRLLEFMNKQDFRILDILTRECQIVLILCITLKIINKHRFLRKRRIHDGLELGRHYENRTGNVSFNFKHCTAG